MSFPAQYEHVLSLNNFTMFNRRGPAITVECTIKHMSELEDVLMFPRDNTASIFVNGKFVDVTNPFELYSITNRDGSRTFPLCMDRKLTIEYPITFAEANTDDPLNSVEIWRHRAAPQDFQLLFPTHISAIISNENPFPVSVIVLNDVSWWEMPLKNLTCTIYSQPISCIDPTLGDSRIALPSIPAHAEILLEIEWEAPTQLMQSGAPNLVRATHQGGSDATSSNVEIRAV
ncbi:hypothetical protein C8Q74DRAFT_1256942 [Fomes fomentarius]|nr:hypothetical protein C8Q74DRAFT_1256942 [Fomes fomentarius]